MAKLPNRLVIEITNTDKVDELGNPVVDFESKDYAECIIEELEKIKEEMEELAFLYDDLSPDKELVVDLYNIETVIDNHISELKGEQE